MTRCISNNNIVHKIIALVVLIAFTGTSITVPSRSYAADPVLGLPAPGVMVNLSTAYQPVMIKGLTVHKDNPFLFDFIVDAGQDKMSGEPLKKEGEKLIKYFLASLAIPDKDVWVNLSPYEKDKIIPDALGKTDMGRDLLEQDYVLKQITASLIYPEKQLGKTFWDKVYAKAQAMYGTTQIPVNTFNKVWIMADQAQVFEHNQTAFVVGSHLKVMLEEDYLALQKHNDVSKGPIASTSQSVSLRGTNAVSDAAISKKTINSVEIASPSARNDTHGVASQIVREIILPQLEEEVNQGKNFANLRQIVDSLILANWYKKNLRQALLNQVYANQSKVKGIDLNDPTIKEQIYEQYLRAYKKGVFNYIKEDINDTGESVPRKYFSGGFGESARFASPAMTADPAVLARALPGRNLVDFSTLTSIQQQATAPIQDATIGAMEMFKELSDPAMQGRFIEVGKQVEAKLEGPVVTGGRLDPDLKEDLEALIEQVKGFDLVEARIILDEDGFLRGIDKQRILDFLGAIQNMSGVDEVKYAQILREHGVDRHFVMEVTTHLQNYLVRGDLQRRVETGHPFVQKYGKMIITALVLLPILVFLGLHGGWPLSFSPSEETEKLKGIGTLTAFLVSVLAGAGISDRTKIYEEAEIEEIALRFMRYYYAQHSIDGHALYGADVDQVKQVLMDKWLMDWLKKNGYSHSTALAEAIMQQYSFIRQSSYSYKVQNIPKSKLKAKKYPAKKAQIATKSDSLTDEDRYIIYQMASEFNIFHGEGIRVLSRHDAVQLRKVDPKTILIKDIASWFGEETLGDITLTDNLKLMMETKPYDLADNIVNEFKINEPEVGTVDRKEVMFFR